MVLPSPLVYRALGQGPGQSGADLLSPRRLVELAPQYYLSNLPPSESRDLLMELREKLLGAAEPLGQLEPALDGAGDGEGEGKDVCALQ